MPAEDVHAITIYISDDWCGKVSYIYDAIHICDKEPGHLEKGNHPHTLHACEHGGTCGIRWIDQ